MSTYFYYVPRFVDAVLSMNGFLLLASGLALCAIFRCIYMLCGGGR